MKDGRIINKHGSVHWYENGQFHRLDGPAIEEPTGTRMWYLNGKRHREDGPAVEYSNGVKLWYLENRQVTEEEFDQWVEKKNLNEKLQSTLAFTHKEKIRKI